MQVIDGNILDADAEIIAHQCNCTSTGVAGVAAAIFDRFPAANDNKRGSQGSFGTTKLHQVETGKYVANLFAQIQPATADASKGDGKFARAEAFKKSLRELVVQVNDLGLRGATVALPYLIGCGLAGGNWDIYTEILESFEADYRKTCGGEIVLYRYQT